MFRVMRVGCGTVLLMLVFGTMPGCSLLPSVGVKAGVNVADVDHDNVGTKNGFVGGAFADVPILPVRAELLYSQKGFNDGTLGTTTDWETSYDFFEVPVMFRLKIPLIGIAPFAYGGLSAGFLTSADSKSSETNDNWVDIKSDNPDIVWGIPLGAGLELARWHFDIRYNFGLTEMKDPTLGAAYEDRTWSFMIGWALF
jgi:hypothetical protein